MSNKDFDRTSPIEVGDKVLATNPCFSEFGTVFEIKNGQYLINNRWYNKRQVVLDVSVGMYCRCRNELKGSPSGDA
jgi:hypothetical protein